MKNTKNYLNTIKLLLTILTLCFCNSSANAQNQLYPDNFDLASLNGSNGFHIPGLSTSKQFGSDIQFIGDINKDGLEDVAIGSGNATINGNELAGAAYIIFGSNNPFPTPFDVNTLDGTNGFVVEAIAYDERRGATLTGPGDINGDGIDDLIIGGSSSQDEIVIYGSITFLAVYTINDIDGVNGFLIDSNGSGQIASLGDVNGDAINDFIISSPIWSGETWVVFGRSTNFPASIDVSWLDGAKGFRTDDFEGTIPAYKVGGAGDINDDGYNDILIGNWDSTDPAVSYILFGKGTAFDALVDLEALDGTDGFSIDNSGGNFLSFVGALGDINNDGIDDFFSETNAIYGSSDPFNDHFPISDLDGTKGFVLPGSLTSAPIGDVNQDGIDDFISTYGSGGVAYIVFGSTTGFPSPIDGTTLNGVNGFIIEGLKTTNIGRGVSGNGDINGDGFSDFILSSPYPSTEIGDAYVIFGGDHYAMPLNDTYPQAIDVTNTALTIVANSKETGTIHYAIYPGSNYSSKDYDAILSGLGADAYGDFSITTKDIAINDVVTALPTNTSFDVYLFLEDAAGNRGEIYSINNAEAGSTLGTDDYLLSGINIYPNAVETDVNVDLKVDDATYKLTTVNGQILQKGSLNNGNNSIEMFNLSAGVYFLSIQTNDGFMTKKIIKN